MPLIGPILVLIFVVTTSHSAFAAHKLKPKKHSNRPHTINIGYGVGSMLSRNFVSSAGFNNYDITTRTGSCSFGYRYSFSRRLAIGAGFAVERDAGNMHTPNDPNAPIQTGTFVRIPVTIVPVLIFTYAATQHCTFYCTGSVGCTTLLGTDKYVAVYSNQFISAPSTSAEVNAPIRRLNETYLAWYVSPLGVSWKENVVNFYAELGLGYKGIVNGGLRIRL